MKASPRKIVNSPTVPDDGFDNKTISDLPHDLKKTVVLNRCINSTIKTVGKFALSLASAAALIMAARNPETGHIVQAIIKAINSRAP